LRISLTPWSVSIETCRSRISRVDIAFLRLQLVCGVSRGK
jgi:hypothetical protein